MARGDAERDGGGAWREWWARRSMLESLAKIDATPELPWDWRVVSWRPDVTLAFAMRHSARVDWEGVANSALVSREDIRANHRLPWPRSAKWWLPHDLPSYVQPSPMNR